MAIFLECDNKGCFKSNAALLDKTTNEVMCAECGKEIKSISPFMKNQLRFSGQCKKSIKTEYKVCKHCNKEVVPIIKKDQAYCGSCGKNLEISPYMVNALREMSKS